MEPLRVNAKLTIPAHALSFTAIRASGPGGQGVNTTSSAVQLRCDLNSFHIPHGLRERILAHRDRRILASGEILIEASEHRSQARNREAARERLAALLQKALYRRPRRRPTRPSRSSVRRAVRAQKRRKEIKRLRRPPKPSPE